MRNNGQNYSRTFHFQYTHTDQGLVTSSMDAQNTWNLLAKNVTGSGRNQISALLGVYEKCRITSMLFYISDLVTNNFVTNLTGITPAPTTQSIINYQAQQQPVMYVLVTRDNENETTMDDDIVDHPYTKKIQPNVNARLVWRHKMKNRNFVPTDKMFTIMNNTGHFAEEVENLQANHRQTTLSGGAQTLTVTEPKWNTPKYIFTHFTPMNTPLGVAFGTVGRMCNYKLGIYIRMQFSTPKSGYTAPVSVPY